MLLTALAVVWSVRMTRRLRREYQQATEGIGTAAFYLQMGYKPRTLLEQVIEGLPVKVVLAKKGSGKFTVVEVDCSGGIPSQIAVGSSNNYYVELSSLPECSSGDETFDRVAQIKGEESAVLALLNTNARAAIAELQAEHCETLTNRSVAVINGHVLFMQPKKFRSDAKMRDAAKRVVELAHTISVGESIPRCLLNNFESESNENIRYRNLEVLLAEFRASDEAKAGAEMALESPDLKLRIFGAKHCGKEGLAALEAISTDPDVASEHRVAAIDTLRKLGDSSALHALLASLEGPDAVVTAAIAKFVGVVGDVEHEPTLAGLLGHADEAVKVAAAEALGSIGTVKAVEPLLKLRRTGEPVLSATAKYAIYLIQKRVGDVDGGGLSVSEAGGTSGGLAVTADEGELSLEETGES